jgi:hypothetical protein
LSDASGIVLGFLVATAYGAGFHFVVGGPARRIILYLFSGWIGFALGHIVGDLFGIEALKLGAVHLLTASFGAWIALLASWWLGRDDAGHGRSSAPPPRPTPRPTAPTDRSDPASQHE